MPITYRLIKIFITVIAIAAVFAMASCQLFQRGEGGLETGDDPVEEGSVSETESEAKTVVEQIMIWESTGPKVRLQLTEDIEFFSEQNPDLDIQVRHLRSKEELLDEFQASSLAGSGPDIVITDFDSVVDTASRNVAKPLEEEFDYENIIEGLKEISEYQGSWYIMPFRVNDFMMLYYNKESIEEVPSNFEKIIEYSNEVYDEENQEYGFLLNSSEPDWVIPFIGGYSGWIVDYYDDSITLGSEALEETIEFLLYMHNEQEVFPFDIEYSDMDLLFKSGNAHMIINGLWAIPEYKEEGIDFGVSIIPEAPEGSKNPTPMLDGIGFMINMNCYGNKLDAAKKFIDFMLTEEVQVRWIESTNTFPVLNNLDDNQTILDDEHIYYAYRQSKLCRGKPRDELIRVIRDSLRINIESVISGNISVDEVVDKIQEDAINLRNGNIDVEQLNAEDI